MNFEQFLAVLWARKKIILMTMTTIFLIVTVITFRTTKIYSAETTVLVDVKSADPVAGMLSGALLMPGYMATQVDIINSQRVAQRAVKMLNFDKVPSLVSAWQEATSGKQSLESYYGKVLNGSLIVTPPREGNVITIAYSSPDPKAAAAVANIFAQAYIATNLEMLVDPARQYTDWFAVRAKQVRERLEKAQQALSAAQVAKGIVSVDDRLSTENYRLSELSTQYTQIEVQKSDAKSHQQSAESDMQTNPDVLNNGVILSLRSIIISAEGKLQEASNELGPNHPQIKQQKAEIETLKAKLLHEMDNVRASLSASIKINEQKETEVLAALEAQKKRMLELKQQHDELAVLTTDVTNAQRDYDALTLRQNQSELESQNQQTNITVLTPADLPLRAASPKKMSNMILSIFIGLFLGIVVALVREMGDRRIYGKGNLTDLGIPILGILRPARKPPSRWGPSRWLPAGKSLSIWRPVRKLTVRLAFWRRRKPVS